MRRYALNVETGPCNKLILRRKLLPWNLLLKRYLSYLLWCSYHAVMPNLHLIVQPRRSLPRAPRRRWSRPWGTRSPGGAGRREGRRRRRGGGIGWLPCCWCSWPRRSRGKPVRVTCAFPCVQYRYLYHPYYSRYKMMSNIGSGFKIWANSDSYPT